MLLNLSRVYKTCLSQYKNSFAALLPVNYVKSDGMIDAHVDRPLESVCVYCTS